MLTSGTFGPASTTSSRSAALQSCLESRLRQHLTGSDLCEVIWKPWTTPWGQSLSKPRARVRTTSGIDSGLWQTMVSDDAMDREKGKLNSRGEPKLSAQAIQTLWPTPHQNASTGPGTQGRAGGMNIQTAVSQVCLCPTTCDCECPEPRSGTALCSEHCPIHNLNPEPYPDCPVHSPITAMAAWPTPTSLSGGSETSNPPGNSRNNNQIRAHALAATWPTAKVASGDYQMSGDRMILNLSGQAKNTSGSSAPTEKPGALNPEFVCWLMGFPTEWVSCGASVTRSTRGRRRSSSKRGVKQNHDLRSPCRDPRNPLVSPPSKVWRAASNEGG